MHKDEHLQPNTCRNYPTCKTDPQKRGKAKNNHTATLAILNIATLAHMFFMFLCESPAANHTFARYEKYLKTQNEPRGEHTQRKTEQISNLICCRINQLT